MVAFRTVFQGLAHAGGESRAELLLLRDDAGWQALWTRLNRGINPAPAPPEVDWRAELVVALAVGRRGAMGYEVTIDRLVLDGGELVVEVHEDSPQGVVALQAITEPVHIVAVPAADIPSDVILVQRAP